MNCTKYYSFMLIYVNRQPRRPQHFCVNKAILSSCRRCTAVWWTLLLLSALPCLHDLLCLKRSSIQLLQPWHSSMLLLRCYFHPSATPRKCCTSLLSYCVGSLLYLCRRSMKFFSGLLQVCSGSFCLFFRKLHYYSGITLIYSYLIALYCSITSKNCYTLELNNFIQFKLYHGYTAVNRYLIDTRVSDNITNINSKMLSIVNAFITNSLVKLWEIVLIVYNVKYSN